MSKINNLDFAALNLYGDNYLQWALDAKIILNPRDSVSVSPRTIMPMKRIVTEPS